MYKTMTSVLDKNKKPTPIEIKKIPSFIFCRYLSGSPYTIFKANIINQYDKIPIENQYQMIKSEFAGKIKYIPYPKQEKTQDEKIIEYLIDYFKINSEKAKEYLTLINKDELNSIKQMYEKE